MASAPSPDTDQALDQDHVGLEAWKDLLKAHAHLTRELDEELRERHGVALGDFDVLINLANAPGPGRRMCELASAVLLSPSGLSRRVDRLEGAGLVRRERADDDARSIQAGLTPAGNRLLARLQDTHLAGIKERFVDRFNADELETLHELLGRLRGDEAGVEGAC